MTETAAAAPTKPLPANAFTKPVRILKAGPDGSLLPGVIEREVGTFTFKIPTLRDKLRIGARRLQYLSGNAPNMVDMDTLLIAEYAATLPIVLVDVPHGWPKTTEEWESKLDQWTELDEPDIREVYNTFREGVRTFRDGASR